MRKSLTRWHSKMLSMLQKLPSSSQLHLGNSLSEVEEAAEMRREDEISRSPDANAFNIASKKNYSFSRSIHLISEEKAKENTQIPIKQGLEIFFFHNPLLQSHPNTKSFTAHLHIYTHTEIYIYIYIDNKQLRKYSSSHPATNSEIFINRRKKKTRSPRERKKTKQTGFPKTRRGKIKPATSRRVNRWADQTPPLKTQKSTYSNKRERKNKKEQ